MPHSIFLGSALATQDRISFRAPQDDAGARNSVSQKETDDSLQNQPSEKVSLLRRLYNNFKKNILDAFVKPTANQSRNCYGERQNNSFEFVRAHIYYGMVDMVGSLFGFAVMINSL
jgi:metal iron transporter